MACDIPVVERPQHMLMRVAVGIHKDDIDAAVEVNICNLREKLCMNFLFFK